MPAFAAVAEFLKILVGAGPLIASSVPLFTDLVNAVKGVFAKHEVIDVVKDLELVNKAGDDANTRLKRRQAEMEGRK